ncbi:hypothetical protein C2S53_010782 [Perilla frutescens var. hirtella]|uniref:Uncharacterized protein n=1 Tax=Perilla frutescens var. hirtella TaxID=608512 RepID=A0AAD4JP07_PERFH|nr:hypothetical protein C2S53_010782 [Perilla frutescens var. hirtella]
MAMKNYQEKRPNLRQVCEEMREVRVPFQCQGRRRVTQKDTNVIYHEYQLHAGRSRKLDQRNYEGKPRRWRG